MAQDVSRDEFAGAPRPRKKRAVGPACYFSVEKLWSEFRVYKRNTAKMAQLFTVAEMRDHFVKVINDGRYELVDPQVARVVVPLPLFAVEARVEELSFRELQRVITTGNNSKAQDESGI